MSEEKPDEKKPEPPASNEETEPAVHRLLARASAAWFCARHHPDARVKKKTEEELKDAVILAMRDAMMRSESSDKHPQWVWGLSRVVCSSISIENRIRYLFRKYPRADDYRLSDFPMLHIGALSDGLTWDGKRGTIGRPAGDPEWHEPDPDAPPHASCRHNRKSSPPS